jgi:hypothetical protein
VLRPGELAQNPPRVFGIIRLAKDFAFEYRYRVGAEDYPVFPFQPD